MIFYNSPALLAAASDALPFAAHIERENIPWVVHAIDETITQCCQSQVSSTQKKRSHMPSHLTTMGDMLPMADAEEQANLTACA